MLAEQVLTPGPSPRRDYEAGEQFNRDPGSPWSGDTLPLVSGYQLVREIAITAT